MFNGYHKVAHGTSGSTYLSNILKFHTTCCHAELTISQALRVAKADDHQLFCCNKYNDNPSTASGRGTPRQSSLPAAVGIHRRYGLMPYVVDETVRRYNVTRVYKNTSRCLHTTSKRLFAESSSHYASPQRPRQRPIPRPSATGPPPKVNRGLDRPPDHVMYPGIQSLLNPEETRQELWTAQRERMESLLAAHREQLSLIQTAMEQIQAKHRERMRRIQSYDEILSHFPLTEQDLEREVKQARIKAKFDKIRLRRLRIQRAMTTRISKFRSKALRDWEDVHSSIISANAELEQWHQSVASHRQELVVVATQLEATMSTMKNDGVYARGKVVSGVAIDEFEDLLDCTSINGLLRLNDELVTHGISTPSQARSSQQFLPDLGNDTLRKVLIDLAFWSINAHDVFAEIGLHLHSYRQLRTRGLRYKALPELFAYDYKQLFRRQGVRQLSTNSRTIENMICDLRSVLRTLSPSSYHPYKDYPMRNLPTILMFEAKGVLTEYKRVFDPLTIYDPAGDLPLQMAQFNDFRPFYDLLGQLEPIRNEIQDIMVFRKDIAVIEANLAEAPPDLSLVYRWKNYDTGFKNLFREAQHALNLARIWRGVANMTEGIHETRTPQRCAPVREPHLDRTLDLDVRRSQSILNNPSPDIPIPAVSWLPSSPLLYPRHSPVSIHYITTDRSLKPILQRFAGYSVLGIDVVLKESPKTGPNAMKSRVSFLLIASEFEVAIIDMDCLPVSHEFLDRQLFRQTLGNSEIVKVGVHTELQRRTLGWDNCIDLVNAVDLAAERSQPDSYNDPTFQTLSNMVNANFDGVLPKLVISGTVLHQAGSDNPSLYFGHLASRPYAALQLLNKARVQGGRQFVDERPGASLGPIIVHPLPKDYSSRPSSPLKSSPLLRKRRLQYIGALVEGYSQHLVSQSAYLSACRARYLETEWGRTILAGYILLTTFDSSIRRVSSALMPTLRGKIETEYGMSRSITATEENTMSLFSFILLSLTKAARLPLHPGHKRQLQDLSQRLLVTENGPNGGTWLEWVNTVIPVVPDQKLKERAKRSVACVSGTQLDTVSTGKSSPITYTSKPSSTASRSTVIARGKAKPSSSTHKGSPRVVVTQKGNRRVVANVPDKIKYIRPSIGAERLVDIQKPKTSVADRKKKKFNVEVGKIKAKNSRANTAGDVEAPIAPGNILSSFGGFINKHFNPMAIGASPKDPQIVEFTHEKLRDDSTHEQKLSTIEKRTKDDIPAPRPVNVRSPRIITGSFKIPMRRTRITSAFSPAAQMRVRKSRSIQLHRDDSSESRPSQAENRVSDPS